MRWDISGETARKYCSEPTAPNINSTHVSVLSSELKFLLDSHKIIKQNHKLTSKSIIDEIHEQSSNSGSEFCSDTNVPGISFQGMKAYEL